MKRVSKQQFIRYTSKHLKDVPIIVTHRGVDDLIVKEIEEEEENDERSTGSSSDSSI